MSLLLEMNFVAAPHHFSLSAVISFFRFELEAWLASLNTMSGTHPPTFLRDRFFNSSKSEEKFGGFKDATFDI